jgi:hypothetical protein
LLRDNHSLPHSSAVLSGDLWLVFVKNKLHLELAETFGELAVVETKHLCAVQDGALFDTAVIYRH